MTSCSWQSSSFITFRVFYFELRAEVERGKLDPAGESQVDRFFTDAIRASKAGCLFSGSRSAVSGKAADNRAQQRWEPVPFRLNQQLWKVEGPKQVLSIRVFELAEIWKLLKEEKPALSSQKEHLPTTWAGYIANGTVGFRFSWKDGGEPRKYDR